MTFLPQLIEAVDAFLGEYEALSYPWSLIKTHIQACNLYVAPDTLELRPILAPALTHPPFANARQRVYMSATLGDDGDLERCFGVGRIARLPVPEGWDKRGTGRRLPLFPELSPGVDDTIFDHVLENSRRTLVLVPNNRLRDKFQDLLKDKVTVFVGADTEEAVQSFREHPGPAALILANRYDGIDFPGDECRSLVVYGFPVGAGLQEVFLTQRLRAIGITRDRVRTRVTQAMGRCTRDESDYSVVLLFGDDLVKWFCTAENVAGMHPELQAEISFGLENSTDRDADDFAALCDAFLSRSPEWDSVEDFVIAERAKRTKRADAGADALQKSAPKEIEFTYCLWNGQYEEAYRLADEVLGHLSGGEEMRAYRCFWQHEAAVAAFYAWKQSSLAAYRDLAVERLTNAAKGNLGIRWFSTLAAMLAGRDAEEADDMPVDGWASAIEEVLAELALVGSKFDRTVAQMRDYVRSTEAKKFHQGLRFLGRLLGARTYEWDDNAKPDGFWNLNYWKATVFEAKTGEFAPGALSIGTVRQASTHEKCVRDDRLIPDHVTCVTVVISPRTTADPEAKRHGEKLFYCNHEDLMQLFERAVAALTELRVVTPKISQNLFPTEALKVYQKHGAFADSVFELLTKVKIIDLPTPNEKRTMKK